MSVTILEALMNAKHNLKSASIPFPFSMGKEQLHNAVTLLEKGYSLDDDLDEIIGAHGSADAVPDK